VVTEPNERLRVALGERGLTPQDLAHMLHVDAKTIERWIGAGRIPYPRHRYAVAEQLGVAAEDLWPGASCSAALPRPGGTSEADGSEVVGVYPHRWAVPGDLWRTLFREASEEIGVLVYSGLFLSEDSGVHRILRTKAGQGVRIRILLGDPASEHVARRGADEGVGGAMAAKIENALVMYASLRSTEAIQFRLHDTILYNSIYRADDELLVNTHLYGFAAAQAPVLHLRATADGSMVSNYLDSFERVWADAVPLE
jgi:transcriptional regulator with XRE-family HTH domain